MFIPDADYFHPGDRFQVKKEGAKIELLNKPK
jgi:hypothetical protein